MKDHSRVSFAARVAVVCAIAVAASHCGSSPSSPSGTPDVTITIGPLGLSPKEVRIKAQGRVRFVNNDTRPHQITSDPVTIHTDCPAINEVGLLGPGSSGQTGALSAVRTCGFHDHNDSDNPRWTGTIQVR